MRHNSIVLSFVTLVSPPECSTPEPRAGADSLRHQTELRDCYRTELAYHPDMAGTVDLRVSIDERGTVFHCVIFKGDFTSRALSQCLCKQVKQWPIPAALYNAMVGYPVTLYRR